MNAVEPTWVEYAVPLSLGALALAVCVWRKWLWPGGLRGVPYRDAGLNLGDAFIGLSLLLVGMLLFDLVRRKLNLDGEALSPSVDLLRDFSQSQRQALKALLFQALAQLPVVAYVMFRTGVRPGGWDQLGFTGRRPGQILWAGGLGILLGIPCVLATLAATALLAHWLQDPMPQVGHDMLKMIQGADSRIGQVGLVFSAVIVAPVLEEIIFRGLVQTSLLELELARMHRWIVVLLSSITFCSAHVGMPWQTFPALFVLALLLGWLYERTGSLWPSIYVHFFFNYINVMQLLLTQGSTP